MNNTLFSFLIFSACNLLSTSTAIPFNSHQPDFQLINDKSTFDSGPSPPSSVGADFGDPYANSLSNSWLAEEMSGPNAASSHITQQDFMIVPPPPAWQGTDSVVARPGCGSLQPYCCTGRYDSKWNHALQPCWTYDLGANENGVYVCQENNYLYCCAGTSTLVGGAVGCERLSIGSI